MQLDHLFRAMGNELGTFNERVVEYPWVLDNIDRTARTILDIGTAESLLTFELIRRGYDVYGIDPRGFPGHHKLLHFCRGDVCYAPYCPGTFEQIVSVSTLEHLGLGVYGDPLRVNADSLALQEMRRMLKAHGNLIITTPFAKRAYKTWQRVYDLDSLKSLTADLAIEKLEFFGRNPRGVWEKVSIGHFEQSPSHPHGVVCLSLRKTR